MNIEMIQIARQLEEDTKLRVLNLLKNGVNSQDNYLIELQIIEKSLQLIIQLRRL